MIQRVLSYERTPPLSGPLRFLLSAPIFLFLAGALLLWQGPLVLTSRWTPATLAFTHLLTLGFLTMAMIGALLQILPVVADIQWPYPHVTARIVHPLLTLGTLLLCCAFWHTEPWLFRLAIFCLVPAFVWLLVACVIALWHKPKLHVKGVGTVSAISLAIIALLITVLLGTTLAGSFAWSYAVPFMLLTNLHVVWGLSGWVGLLIIGVAFQVVPMFQVTAIYPVDITRLLTRLLFLLLILWSIEAVWEINQKDAITLSGMILSGFIIFAGITLSLLARRKHPKFDAASLFWSTAMASLFACAAVWMSQVISGRDDYAITMGVLFIVGFAGTLVNGMLYRIVPFLLWYHAQSEMKLNTVKIPNVRELLPEQAAIRQFRMHLLALLLLISATLFPQTLARPAALALCISSAWLMWNLWSAVRMYGNARKHSLSAVVSA